MRYYRTCPHCGAHLDSGESCDCISSLYATLSPENRGRIDRFVAELLKKQNAAQGAANTRDGGAEQIDTAASASHDTRE